MASPSKILMFLLVQIVLLSIPPANGTRWAKGATSEEWWSYLPKLEDSAPPPPPKSKSAIIGALQECRQTNMCVTQDSSQDLSPSEGNLEDGEESVGVGCMDKLVMVEEWVAAEEPRMVCHHVEEQSCYTVMKTKYVPRKIKDCQDSFVKECYIATEDVVTPVTVTICEDAFTRNCAPTYREEEGEVCSVEYATVCMSKNEDNDVAGEIRRTKPNECHKEPRKVCGPSVCPVRKGERKCTEKILQVDTPTPREQCDMRPRKRCRSAMRLMPKLVPGNQCSTVPKEVCVTVRSNGKKRVRRPIVMKWCGGNGGNTEEGLTPTVQAPTSSGSPTAAPTTPASAIQVQSTTTAPPIEMESIGDFFAPLVELAPLGGSLDYGDYDGDALDDTMDLIMEPQNEQQAATQSGCPEGDWVADGSKCYLVVEYYKSRPTRGMSWDEANEHCKSFVAGQSHLMEVTTMPEQSMLKKLIEDSDLEFWLGARRDAFNRRKWNWVWSEQETDFSYWAETEPNYEGKCLSVFWRQSNRKWVANKCSYEFGAICELEISP